MKKSKKKHKKKYKITFRKNKKGGFDSQQKVSEFDDACGVAWKYKKNKITFISEKDYKQDYDYLLCKEIKDNVNNEFIEVLKELKNLTEAIYKCNDKFKKNCSPKTFIKWDNNRIKIKNKNNPDFIEDNLNSWFTYAFHDNSKKPSDGGNMSLDDFNNKFLVDKIDLTPEEGSTAIQIFYNRMTVPLTMIILEYDKLRELNDNEVNTLLTILNEDEIERRGKILETYSWLPILEIRKIYKDTPSNFDLKNNSAFHMILGTTDIDSFDLWSGYFGGCHLIGFTTSVKGGGPGCSGYQWPPVRLKNPELNCFTIISSDRSTSFTIDENNDLIFKTSLDINWEQKLTNEKPEWWIKSTKLQKILNIDEIPEFNKNKKPGLYFNKEYIPFQNDDCIVCEVSKDNTVKILDIIKNDKQFYIILKNNVGNFLAWKSDNNLEKNTMQEDENGNLINQGSGGKMFVANPKSFFGIVCKLKEKLAVAGPSGTAWYVFSTAKILNKYKENKLMAKLCLKQIETVCIIPHHSIYEVLLAISVNPINLITFDMSKNNDDYINELYNIGEITLSQSILSDKTNKQETNKPKTNKLETNKPETDKPETDKPESNKPETDVLKSTISTITKFL